MKRLILLILVLFSGLLAEADPPDTALVQIRDLPLATDKGVDSLFFTIEKRASGDVLWRTRKLPYTQLLDWMIDDSQDSLYTYIESESFINKREHYISSATASMQSILNDVEITDSLLVRSFKITGKEDTINGDIVLKSNMKLTFAPDCIFEVKIDSSEELTTPLFDLDSLENVIIDFGGARFTSEFDTTFETQNWFHFLRINGCSNIIVKNAVTEAEPNAAEHSEHYHTISVLNSENVLISGMDCRDNIGDNVYIRGSKNVHVFNNKFKSRTLNIAKSVARNGVSIVDNNESIWIANNYLYGSFFPAAIDVEPNCADTLQYVKNINILYNVIDSDSSRGGGIYATGSCSESGRYMEIDGLNIIGNILRNQYSAGVHIQNGTTAGSLNIENVNISGNYVENCPLDSTASRLWGIGINGIIGHGVKIAGNTVVGGKGYGFFSQHGADNFLLEGNDFINSYYTGAQITGESDNYARSVRIFNNNIINPYQSPAGGGSGIRTNYVQDCQIINNFVENDTTGGNADYGFYFRYTDSTQVLNNRVVGSFLVGEFGWSGFNGNDFSHNYQPLSSSLIGSRHSSFRSIDQWFTIQNNTNDEYGIRFSNSFNETGFLIDGYGLGFQRRYRNAGKPTGSNVIEGAHYVSQNGDSLFYYLQNGWRQVIFDNMTLGSGTETSGKVLTADGSGGSSWESVSAAALGGASDNIASDGSIEWEDAAGLNSDGSIATGAVDWTDLSSAARAEAQKDIRVWSIVIDSSMISTSADVSFFYAAKEIVVDTLCIVQSGGSTPSLKVDIHHGSNRSASGTALITTTSASTDTTTGHKITSFNNGTIAPGSFVWIEFDAVTSKPRECMINLIEVD